MKVYSALMTPFDSEGRIQEDAFRRIIQRQVRAKVTGIIPCGSTGENPTLTGPERLRLIHISLEETKGSPVEVIAGTGTSSTQETIELSKAADAAGCHGILVVSPPYNRPNERGLITHFQKVADSVQGKVVMYNVPGRTGGSISARVAAELAKHPRIAALKESSGQLNLIQDIHRLIPKGSLFEVWAGDDSLWLPFASLGAKGVVSVASNLIPETFVALAKTLEEGTYAISFDRYRHLFPLFSDLFLESNPAPVKYLGSKIYGFENILRLPLVSTSEATEKTLDQYLEQIKAP